jgi:hypothetical protein
VVLVVADGEVFVVYDSEVVVDGVLGVMAGSGMRSVHRFVSRNGAEGPLERCQAVVIFGRRQRACFTA